MGAEPEPLANNRGAALSQRWESQKAVYLIAVENRRLHSLTPDRAAVPSMNVMAMFHQLTCRDSKDTYFSTA